MPKNPDFFVIPGAQRCGTTYLYRLLDEHPEVSLAKPIRPEPKVFLEDNSIERGIDFYLKRHFKLNKETKLIGEKSTSYLESHSSALRMKAMFKRPKALILIRNPVDRAISNYYFSVANNLETRSIEEVFIPPRLQSHKFETSVSPYAYLERGDYEYHIKFYVKTFGSGNVKVILFEELISSDMVYRDILEFLQLSNFHKPSAVNSRVNENPPYQIDPILRQMLNQYFAAKVESLERYLGIDLNLWRHN